jgi:hypothetical protein
LSPSDALQILLDLPPVPSNIREMPSHIRMHHLMGLRDLHIPTHEGIRLQSTIDLMVRQGYRYRDPSLAATWCMVGGEESKQRSRRSPALASIVDGYSGCGKTEAVLRGLSTYPNQVIFHNEFPRMSRGLPQVVWLSADVPASGRTSDLATNLMIAWDRLLQGERFSRSLARSVRPGIQMLDEWRQVASAHFLGILHLDEIQNFFKLSTLEQRKRRKNKSVELELSIVEDACLKWILTLTNISQIPLLLSGTPDGVAAMTKRMSTTQRIVTGGYHCFANFENLDDPRFSDVFFPRLCEYQFVDKKLPKNDALAELILELTGGIPRIIIALWIAAHRVAFERKTDDLRITDFQKASDTYLAPIAPAVSALRSKDPKRMARYEDLLLGAEYLGAGFWDAASRV